MTELEKKLDKCSELHKELKEVNATLTMKSGQLDDLMKDIFTTHLGFSRDAKEIPLPDLLKKTFFEGKK